MKTFSALPLLLIFSCLGIKAQKPILVSEDSISFGKSKLPGFSVTIPEVNFEKTLKVWIRDLQSGTKSKVIKENNEMSIFGAKIKEISPNPINVYSKMTTMDSMIHLTVSFELKKDQYVERTTGVAEFPKTQKYLKDFAKNQYIELAKDQADTEEKKLRNFQKELSSLENDKSRLQKSIQSNNSTIVSEKENLVVQNNELTTVSAALVEHNNQLSKMEAGPAMKEKVEYIKDLEKRKKKALNSIQSSENKINRSNTEIDKANNEIPKNENMQKTVRVQIANQEAVSQKFAYKLERIKSY